MIQHYRNLQVHFVFYRITYTLLSVILNIQMGQK